MREDLIARFAPHTIEEQHLLKGEPLKMCAYTDRAFFTVQGSRFVPREEMIALRPNTRFAFFPMHRHDYVEMMYVLSGQACHQMSDGREIALHAGELLLINRHSSHSIKRCGEADVAVNFIIRPAFFNALPDFISLSSFLGRFLLDALRKEEKDVSYLYFKVADLPEIQCLLESVIYTLLDPNAFGVGIKRTQMGLLFLHLLKHPERMVMPAAVSRENLFVLDLLKQIREHYATFVLSDFAFKKRVSSAYLCRVLKQATGKTCTQLLQERRIDRAKRFLVETDLSVLEICEAVGYSNTSYFYRIFEAATGQSPSLYRVNSGRTGS